jgi:hypothetical protein
MKKYFCITLLFLFAISDGISAQSIYETNEYKISFPGTTTTTTQSLSSALAPLKIIITSYEPAGILADSNHVYMILESEYPDSIIHSDMTEKMEVFFRKTIDGTVKSAQCILLSETKIQTGKYPSRIIEMDLKQKSAIIKLKMILIKSKLVIIETITAYNMYPNKKMDQFIDSFILK